MRRVLQVPVHEDLHAILAAAARARTLPIATYCRIALMEHVVGKSKEEQSIDELLVELNDPNAVGEDE